MLKDFSVYKKFIIGLSLFLIVLAMLVTFVNTNTIGMFVSSVGNSIMAVIGSFMLEQQNKKPRMLTSSLPVSRKEILIAHYLTSLLIITANVVLLILAFNFFEGFLHPNPQYITSIDMILFLWFYVLIQLSLYYFFFYRFKFIITMIVYLLPIMVWNIIAPKATFINDIFLGDHSLLLIWCLGGLGLFMLSFYSNLIYFQKKEL